MIELTGSWAPTSGGGAKDSGEEAQRAGEEVQKEDNKADQKTTPEPQKKSTPEISRERAHVEDNYLDSKPSTSKNCHCRPRIERTKIAQPENESPQSASPSIAERMCPDQEPMDVLVSPQLFTHPSFDGISPAQNQMDDSACDRILLSALEDYERLERFEESLKENFAPHEGLNRCVRESSGDEQVSENLLSSHSLPQTFFDWFDYYKDEDRKLNRSGKLKVKRRYRPKESTSKKEREIVWEPLKKNTKIINYITSDYRDDRSAYIKPLILDMVSVKT